jgi:hypothetical protein
MARKDGTGSGEEGRPVPNVSRRLRPRNINALNGAVKLALDAQTVADRYSEAHRRFAVLMWRGTLPLHADGDGSSAIVVAQRAINTPLAHAAALAELAKKLQLESLTIFQRSAVDNLNLLEPQIRHGRFVGDRRDGSFVLRRYRSSGEPFVQSGRKFFIVRPRAE